MKKPASGKRFAGILIRGIPFNSFFISESDKLVLENASKTLSLNSSSIASIPSTSERIKLNLYL